MQNISIIFLEQYVLEKFETECLTPGWINFKDKDSFKDRVFQASTEKQNKTNCLKRFGSKDTSYSLVFPQQQSLPKKKQLIFFGGQPYTFKESKLYILKRVLKYKGTLS